MFFIPAFFGVISAALEVEAPAENLVKSNSSKETQRYPEVASRPRRVAWIANTAPRSGNLRFFQRFPLSTITRIVKTSFLLPNDM